MTVHAGRRTTAGIRHAVRRGFAGICHAGRRGLAGICHAGRRGLAAYAPMVAWFIAGDCGGGFSLLFWWLLMPGAVEVRMSHAKLWITVSRLTGTDYAMATPVDFGQENRSASVLKGLRGFVLVRDGMHVRTR